MYHSRGRALSWLGVIATYQTIANSEYRSAIMGDRHQVLTSGVRGKQPRPPAKVPNDVLSGKRSGKAQTARMLA